jgi:hypothetical protein
MFGLFKNKPKQMTGAEYQTEYRRYLRELGEQFAVGDSPQEQLLNAMGLVDHEMNGNGGCNWEEKDYFEYLDTLREHLTTESRFTSEQLDKIRRSFDDILACARELDQKGESARGATEAVDYLITRVVDWLHWNPRTNDDA